jgi:plasmid stabilization system protein ParE
MSFLLHPLAEQELQDSVAYYHTISPKLGLAFTQSVYEAIQQAIMFPNAWTPVTPYIRRVLTHKFPYGILYQHYEKQIVVLAVMNLNRKPDYWLNRLE